MEKEVFVSMLFLFGFFFLFLTAKQRAGGTVHFTVTFIELLILHCLIARFYSCMSLYLWPFTTGLGGAGEVTLHSSFSSEIVQKVFCSIEVNCLGFV